MKLRSGNFVVNQVNFLRMKKYFVFIIILLAVTEYDNLDPFPEGSAYSLPNYVMIFNNHAVNAYKMSKLWGGLITIYYEDHSSTTTGGGFILGREMRRIYVFD